jgi:hypothetical protein
VYTKLDIYVFIIPLGKTLVRLFLKLLHNLYIDKYIFVLYIFFIILSINKAQENYKIS